MGVLDQVVGPVVIATWVNCLMFQQEIVLLWRYFSHYPNDSIWIKLSVGALFTADLVATVAISACCYLYAVTHWGDVPYLATQNTALPINVMANAVSGFIVHSFMTFRVYQLSKSYIWAGILAAMTCTEVVPAFLTANVSLHFSSYAMRSKVTLYVEWWLGMAMSTDVCITFSLVYLLNKARKSVSNFKQSQMNGTLKKLIRLCIESGMAISIWAILELAIYIGHQETNIAAAFTFCQGRVFALTMLANLNMRKSTTRGTLFTEGGNIDTRESTSGTSRSRFLSMGGGNSQQRNYSVGGLENDEAEGPTSPRPALMRGLSQTFTLGFARPSVTSPAALATKEEEIDPFETV